MVLPQRVLDLALLPWIQDSPGPLAGPGTVPSSTGEGTQQTGMFSQVIPFLAIGVLFYFLLIVPERKRKQAREALLAGLGKNDEVMTTGGLFGVITKGDAETVTLRVDEGVHIRVAKASIQGPVGAEDTKPK